MTMTMMLLKMTIIMIMTMMMRILLKLKVPSPRYWFNGPSKARNLYTVCKFSLKSYFKVFSIWTIKLITLKGKMITFLGKVITFGGNIMMMITMNNLRLHVTAMRARPLLWMHFWRRTPRTLILRSALHKPRYCSKHSTNPDTTESTNPNSEQCTITIFWHHARIQVKDTELETLQWNPLHYWKCNVSNWDQSSPQ